MHTAPDESFARRVPDGVSQVNRTSCGTCNVDVLSSMRMLLKDVLTPSRTILDKQLITDHHCDHPA